VRRPISSASKDPADIGIITLYNQVASLQSDIIMSNFTEPWSFAHKKLTNHGQSVRYNLSNSYAQPLTHSQLLEYARERGDTQLVREYGSDHSLEYTPNGGSLDIRQEIANLYADNIHTEHVIVFAGAQVAIQTAAFAVAKLSSTGRKKKKRRAITFCPGYQSVQEAPLHAGFDQVTRIPLRADRGWQIDVDEVQRAIAHESDDGGTTTTTYLVLNQPHNPSGTLMNREAQEELVELASQHDIPILCDEVYRLLEHDAAERIPAMCEIYEQGMSVVTLSKPWGACGTTVGWIATRSPELMQQLHQIQYFGTACSSRASELQAVMVLRASDQILDRNLKIIRSNVQLLEAFMNRQQRWFTWVKPSAGAICAIRFKGPLTSEQFAQLLAKDALIGVKPAYCFSKIVTEEVDYFRVGFGETSFRESIQKLEEFVLRREAEWEKSHVLTTTR